MCVLFVVPLLIAYEIGLHQLTTTPEALRTGADTWVRLLLERCGIVSNWTPPVCLVAGLLAWGFFQPRQRLDDPVGTWIGMVFESVLFAGLLFGLIQIAFPLLATLGSVLQDPLVRFLSVTPGEAPEVTWERIVRFMGAGIYEEAIFRLVLFSSLRFLFLAGDFQELWANVLAGIISAIGFAAAHHLGAGQETINVTVFLYRVLAGLYFAALFQIRGFGIAVGAHAGFDVLVGLILR